MSTQFYLPPVVKMTGYGSRETLRVFRDHIIMVEPAYNFNNKRIVGSYVTLPYNNRIKVSETPDEIAPTFDELREV